MPRSPLVLLPGLLNTRRVFDHQVEALADVASFTIPELWHHDTMAAMAEATLAVAPPSFALCGFSMGGYVAFEIFRRAPERVERIALMDLTKQLATNSGIAVLFTEHDMDVVFGTADRILVLNRGRLIAEGAPADIRANAEVRAIYLGGHT